MHSENSEVYDVYARRDQARYVTSLTHSIHPRLCTPKPQLARRKSSQRACRYSSASRSDEYLPGPNIRCDDNPCTRRRQLSDRLALGLRAYALNGRLHRGKPALQLCVEL